LAILPLDQRRGAREIIHRKPSKSWKNLRRIPGFSDTVMEEIKGSGAPDPAQKDCARSTGRKEEYKEKKWCG
jgi:hypothetical protein